MTSPRRPLRSTLTVGACLSVLALGLSACDEETAADQAPASSPTSATDSPSPSAGGSTATDSPAADPSEGTATGGATVPAYFAGDTPQGPRLFREFRQVTGDPLLAAATLVAGGSPTDPDYRTLWPAVEISAVTPTDGVLLVELPGDEFTTRPDGMSAKDAALAIQQLVYTLQGVQQERVPVHIQRTGTPTLFGLPTDQPFTATAPLDVLALVSVTGPEQGATVRGDELAASGVASSFEATVPWEVRRGDEVVLDGFATAEGWMDKLYPWQTTIDVSSLEPGDYTFAAMTDDPSGGEGGGPTEDTKDFTRP